MIECWLCYLLSFIFIYLNLSNILGQILYTKHCVRSCTYKVDQYLVPVSRTSFSRWQLLDFCCLDKWHVYKMPITSRCLLMVQCYFLYLLFILFPPFVIYVFLLNVLLISPNPKAWDQSSDIRTKKNHKVVSKLIIIICGPFLKIDLLI